MMSNLPFQVRVGILGCPSRPQVAWTIENLRILQDLGFNTMQLNIAWGYRPADEPLNLEDVVDLPLGCQEFESERAVPVRSDPSRRVERKADLRQRIQLCRQVGMRSIFHFGAPNNAFYDPNFTNFIKGQMAHCLLDRKTPDYYACLLKAFFEEFPGVDDILMYTYDQDAWLCNEFGDCPYCSGVPLHERVTPFVNRMARTWNQMVPAGRLWWEPWELSAGQVLQCVERLDCDCVGLSLHTNIAEAQVTVVADGWFKNTARLAASRNIPVIGENFLGAASEEVEPYTHLSHPLVVLRMLRSVAQVEGVVGIKEYYGLLPDQLDINLKGTGLFLHDPTIEEETALHLLSIEFGAAAEQMESFWRLTSEAMELFPWDSSWFIREIGKSDPVHSMSAAFLRGYCAETPSWLATRDAIFMKVNNEEPHPWMLEDVQLRCEMASRRIRQALEIGQKALSRIPQHNQEAFSLNLEELQGFLQRTLAYIYHIRATNLAMIMRQKIHQGKEIPALQVEELLNVMVADQENQDQPEPLQSAIQLLKTNLRAFLDRYYTVEPNIVSKGYFSLTSR